VCASSSEALDLQVRAEAQGWEVCALAGAPVDTIENAGTAAGLEGADPDVALSAVRIGPCGALRLEVVKRLSDEAALDLGLTQWLQKEGRIKSAVGDGALDPAKEPASVTQKGTVAEMLKVDRRPAERAARTPAGPAKSDSAESRHHVSAESRAAKAESAAVAPRSQAPHRRPPTPPPPPRPPPSEPERVAELPLSPPRSPEWVAETAALLTGASKQDPKEVNRDLSKQGAAAHWQEPESEDWYDSERKESTEYWQEPASAHEEETWEDTSWSSLPNSSSWWNGQEAKARQGARNGSKWSSWNNRNSATWKGGSWSETEYWSADDTGSRWAESEAASFSEKSWSGPGSKEPSPQKEGEQRRRALLNKEHLRIAVDSHLRGLVQRQ